MEIKMRLNQNVFPRDLKIELDEMLNQKIEVEVQFLAMLKAIEYFKAVESTIRVSLSPIGSTILSPSDSENGDEELLQRDQGNESEGRAEAREADGNNKQRQEYHPESFG
ncbi:hypothetical protein L1987_87420 [Smallanthus sonchifolius]|nr:hypothetical protein L1987_87420 [Smallanthus sonchifolius]